MLVLCPATFVVSRARQGRWGRGRGTRVQSGLQHAEGVGHFTSDFRHLSLVDVEEKCPIGGQILDTIDMAAGTRRRRVTREARRELSARSVRVSDDPRLSGIASRVVAAVALGASARDACCVMAIRASVGVLPEEGDRMIGRRPLIRVWHLDSVTGCAELRLRVTRVARVATLTTSHVWMSSEPRIADVTGRMVACVAIGPRPRSYVGRVACVASVIALVEEDLHVAPREVSRVGHGQTMASCAELLVGVTRRAYGLVADLFRSVGCRPLVGPMAGWARDHPERMTRPAAQRNSRRLVMAHHARVHRGPERLRSHVGLRRVTRAATDVRCRLMLFVVEQQDHGITELSAGLEVLMAVEASDDLAICEALDRRRRLHVGGIAASGATDCNRYEDDARTGRPPGSANPPGWRHVRTQEWSGTLSSCCVAAAAECRVIAEVRRVTFMGVR